MCVGVECACVPGGDTVFIVGMSHVCTYHMYMEVSIFLCVYLRE